jgi:hypothetical protein
MGRADRLAITYKALAQLGFQPVMLNALYRLGLATGHYRRATEKISFQDVGLLRSVLPIPKVEVLQAVLGEEGKKQLLTEADEIIDGKVRLFGGEPAPLILKVEGVLAHWTAYETGRTPLPTSSLPFPDIKSLWEPARFGWAFTLGRAYFLTRQEKYAESFWRYFEAFTGANPPCLGPHWISGQEVALRLMAFAWIDQILSDSPASTEDRRGCLASSVAAHAARIPPTMVYARSQQNNHLLTEAAGLLTAGAALPDIPESDRWSTLGWKWLNLGLRAQIDGYGEYSQHSTNYQRLMLQVALWVNTLIQSPELHLSIGGRRQSPRWPRETLEAIVRSTHWLLALLDQESGQVPNLGANDGAYLFSSAACPFSDYRPVLNAAARAFLRYEFPGGSWDELCLWYGIPLESKKYMQLPRYVGDQLYGKDSWAFLRTAQFNSRPSHADQLHLDLWWRGINITRDAGTYLYNVDSPWDNQLTVGRVHNTVTLDGRDQFTRAGRFLYLDWFDAYRENSLASSDDTLQCASAHYHAYRKPGVRHTRTVTAFTDGRWKIEDELLVTPSLIHSFAGNSDSHISRSSAAVRPTFRLHWLLPDWEWEIHPLTEGMDSAGCELRLRSPYGWLIVKVSGYSMSIGGHENAEKAYLARAGKCLHGQAEPLPIDGWYSPTYEVKNPALSLSLTLEIPSSGGFSTEFIFPK